MPFVHSSATDPGEWFPYGKDHDGAEIRFKVRRLTGGKESEIELRHQKRTEFHVKRKHEGASVVQEGQTKLAIDLDKAAFALVDSEHCAIVPPDEYWASKWAEALGRTVNPGEVIVLDGLWNITDKRQRYVVKELFLPEFTEVEAFIIEKAKAMGLQAAQENEEGKGDS